MIADKHENEKQDFETASQFSSAMKELKIPSLLKRSNIRKDCRKTKSGAGSNKRSAFEIFQFLVLLVFQGCNLFRFLESKKKDTACSKNTYYRFLNDCHYNWRAFVTLLAAEVVSRISVLTRPERRRCFVVDDSVIPRERSKSVELLSWVFDHVRGKSVKGFNLLTVGWTDLYSFIPVGFNMLASAKAAKRVPMSFEIDKRTNGYKNRSDAIMQKPDATIALIKAALQAGIEASYVLMDTWFTNEPFIKRILELGLDVIGMLKDNRQGYWYKGRLCQLRELATLIDFEQPGDIFGSVLVRTKTRLIPVKLVFVRNRNKRNEYIILLSTDYSLSNSEIVRTYGGRWAIECFHKVCKSLLKLGKEFHGISYDMTVSSTAIIYARFIILKWIRRKQNDPRTISRLFFYVSDEVRDIELEESLKKLMTLFVTGIKEGMIKICEAVRIQLVKWFTSQPKFIRLLFPAFLEGINYSQEGTSAPIPCQY